jgi:hypothetical protein
LGSQITIDFPQIRIMNIKKRSICINFGEKKKRRAAEDESKTK